VARENTPWYARRERERGERQRQLRRQPATSSDAATSCDVKRGEKRVRFLPLAVVLIGALGVGPTTVTKGGNQLRAQ
jgi:hypothetical protein